MRFDIKKILILLVYIASVIWGGCSSHAAEEAVVVISYAGDVKVIPPSSTEKVACKPGMILKEGTRVVTGKESYLKIAFDRSERNVVKIEENSEVVIKLDGDDKIELVDGKVFASLQDIKKGETFRIRTPCATCGARGTGWLTETDGSTMNVSVYEGTVFVRGMNKDGTVMEKEYLVKEGFQRKVNIFKRPEKPIKIPERKFTQIKDGARGIVGVRHPAKEGANPLVDVPRELITEVIKDTEGLIGLRREPEEPALKEIEKPEVIEVDRTELIERIESSGAVTDKLERIETFEKPEFFERPEVFGRDERPEKPERPEMPPRDERFNKIERPRVLDSNLRDKINTR